MSSGNTNPSQINTLPPEVKPLTSGNKQDFWHLWAEYKGFLLNLCRRWTKGNDQEAQEILSGAMIQCWEFYAASQQRIYNPQAWLAKSLRNYSIDYFRKSRRFPDLSIDLELLSNAVSSNQSSDERSPEKGMMDSEGYDQLKSVIEKLPDRLKRVMILKAYHEMPTREIAQYLQITPANVRKRIQTARSLVKRALENQSDPYNRNRIPDPNLDAPRSERRAADDVLQRVPDSSFLTEPMAQLVTSSLDPHRSVELPVSTLRKPIRIAQKLKSVNNYIQKHPSGWIKRKEKALLLALNGQFKYATQELEMVLAQQPQLVEIRILLAKWLHWQARKLEAIQVLEEGLAFKTKTVWRLVLEAQLLSYHGDHLGTTRLLEQACLIAPRPAFQVLLAQNLMACSDWPQAVSHLRQNPLRRGRILLITALKKLELEEERNHAILSLFNAFPEDPQALAFTLESRIRMDMVDGEAGRVTKNLLHELKRQAPQSAPALFAEIAFWTQKQKSNRALDLLIKTIHAHPPRLQDLRLGQIWLTRLSGIHLSPNLDLVQQELFPDTSPWSALLQSLPFCY